MLSEYSADAAYKRSLEALDDDDDDDDFWVDEDLEHDIAKDDKV